MKRKRSEVCRFISDIANHRLKVIRDDGLYRHLRMQNPGTSCYYYDIVTWPGYLCVTGDMGTWTFSRIADMFDFFGGAFELGINTHYWSEKLEAGAGNSAREAIAREYDHDAFCESLLEWQNDYLEVDEDAEPEPDEDWNDDDDREDSDEARIREIVRELTRAGFSNDVEAYQAVDNADWPEGMSTWDICESLTFKTYTSHFRWILMAIVWGIGKYFNTKLVDKAMDVYAGFYAIHGNKNAD